MRSPRLIVFVAVFFITTAALAQTARSGRVSSSSSPSLPVAPNAFGWQSGTLQNTTGNDCFDIFSGTYNIGWITGSFVSYYGDPVAGHPKVGDVYYTSIYIQTVSVCQGAAVQAFLIPAADTYLAISSANPVICFRNGSQVTTGCPQNPAVQTSLSGATGYYLGLWSLPAGGHSVEILVPVFSTASGFRTLYTRVDTADGSFNQWATPNITFSVTPNPPTIGYPDAATTNITSVSARTTADIFNHFVGGTLYFDIGTTTSYGTSTAGNAVPSTSNSGQYYVDWGSLSPGTLYHWRARFIPNTGATVFGADRTFTTTGTVSVPDAPTGVGAVAAPGEIYVTWSAVTGATSYDVYRRAEGSASYDKIGMTSITAYHDTSAEANKAYLYRVRAVNGAGSSPDSAFDLATMILFADDPLSAGTPILISHLAQLRAAVSAVGALGGGIGLFTDPATVGLPVKALHVEQLRTQLDAALSALGIGTSSYTDAVAAGTPIRAVHFQELRNRLK